MFGEDAVDEILPWSKVHKGLPSAVISLFEQRDLIERNGDDYLVLPKLSVVWDQAKGQDVTILSEVLQRKAAEEKAKAAQSLNFLGFSISASLVFWVGPMLICAILSFMCVLTDHIKRTVYLNQSEVRGFPWADFVVFWRGRAFLIVTVLLLPMSAGVSVICISAERNWKTIAVVVVFGVLCALLSGVVLNETLDIARKMGDASPESDDPQKMATE